MGFNLLIVTLFGQKPDTLWTKTIGGPGSECGGYSVADRPKMVYSTDGNLFITGVDTGSFVPNNNGAIDIFITKVNLNGDTIWAKNYGGEDLDYITDIIPTADGGAMFCGYTYSLSNFGVHHDGSESQDGFIAKIDANGSLIWIKQYGGGDFLGSPGNDVLNKLIDLGNGNYFAVGQTTSNNGDLVVDLTKFACGWLLKIDAQGTKISSTKIASPDHDEWNGNIFKSGALLSDKKEIILFGEITYWQAAYKNWLVKIDTSGIVQWQKTNGCLSDNSACDIMPLNNNDAVFTSVVYSQDGDVTTPVYINGLSGDVWIAKIDSSGTIVKQKTIGGWGHDLPRALAVKGSDVFVGGMSNSHMFDPSLDSLGTDFFMFKLNNDFDTVWTMKFGGSGSSEQITSIVLNNNTNHFLVCGKTNSNDGYIQGNHGNTDVWIGEFVDFSMDVTSLSNNNSFSIYPNPANKTINIGAPQNFINNTKLVVYNMLGEQVYENQLQEGRFSINVEQFPNGLYFVTLVSQNKSIMQKLVINR